MPYPPAKSWRPMCYVAHKYRILIGISISLSKVGAVSFIWNMDIHRIPINDHRHGRRIYFAKNNPGGPFPHRPYFFTFRKVKSIRDPGFNIVNNIIIKIEIFFNKLFFMWPLLLLLIFYRPLFLIARYPALQIDNADGSPWWRKKTGGQVWLTSL